MNTSTIDRIRAEIRQIGYKYGNRLFEWIHVAHILEDAILPVIYEEFLDQVKALENENRQLNAKLNQLSFGNDPERDRRMIELFKFGYSRGRIAKEVGMSKWGVSKALRRLGVN